MVSGRKESRPFPETRRREKGELPSLNKLDEREELMAADLEVVVRVRIEVTLVKLTGLDTREKSSGRDVLEGEEATKRTVRGRMTM